MPSIRSLGAGAISPAWARPGGNITGLSSQQVGTGARSRFELLTQVSFPTRTRLADALRCRAILGPGWAPPSEAATALNLRVQALRCSQTSYDFDAAFVAPDRAGRRCCPFCPAPLFLGRIGPRVVELATRHRLPSMCPSPNIVSRPAASCPMGPTSLMYRRAAAYVDRILKGAKPADLPVQAADEVRAGHQPQDRQGARPRCAADAARPRRRGDRVKAARVHHAARRRGGCWPLAARAQQPERMRRIGVLSGHGRGRSGQQGTPRGIPAAIAAIGLDRRPQCAD